MIKNKLIGCLFLFCIILILQEDYTSQSINDNFSILMYFVPIWVFLFALIVGGGIRKRSYEGIFFSRILVMYILVFFIPTLFIILSINSNFIGPYLWNILKIGVPLSAIIVIALLPGKHSLQQLYDSVDFILYSTMLALLPKILYAGLSKFSLENIIFSGDLPTESDTLCFAFGFLSAHYLERGNIKKLLLSLFFVLLTGKRIVFIGLLLLIVLRLPLMRRLIVNHYKKFIFIIVLLNCCYAYFLYDLGSGEGKIIDIIESMFSKTANEITVGRSILYERIIEKMGFPKLTGNGVGSVIYTLRKISPNELWLHSDILMNFYDIGIVGCIFWLIYMYNHYRFNTALFSLLLLYNIFMLTDNTFYYIVPNFLFYYLSFVSIKARHLRLLLRPKPFLESAKQM